MSQSQLPAGIRNDRDEVTHQDFVDALEKIEADDSSDVVSSAGYFYQ